MFDHLHRTQALGSLAVAALLFASCSSASGTPSVGNTEDSDATLTTETSSIGDTEDGDAEGSDSVGSKIGTITESAYFGDYELVDDEHGASVAVTLTENERQLTSNGLPNHETGDFPTAGNPNTISEQEFAASFPLEPTYTGDQTFAKEPGVTVSGVKFDPQTAERATCDNNVEYSIEALQDTVDLGLDFNNAHVQPTGAYHYHGISQELMDSIDPDQDLLHVGFAYDGFMIYYSRSGAYTPSYQLSTEDREGTNCIYEDRQSGEEIPFEGPTPDGSFVEDWDYIDGMGDLDECNGIEINGEYAYLMTDTFPYIGRCLNGEFEATGPGSGEEPGGEDSGGEDSGGEGPGGEGPGGEGPGGEGPGGEGPGGEE